MSRPLKDSDPKKWESKSHTFVKHDLFQKYFTVWLIILGESLKTLGI